MKKISELESSATIKDAQINVLNGVVNSLEEDMKPNDAKIAKLGIVSNNMKKVIDKLREFKAAIEKNKKGGKGVK